MTAAAEDMRIEGDGAGTTVGVRDLLSRGDRPAWRSAILAYAIRIGNAILLFVVQILLARWMGEFQYGIYVLVWTWVTLLGELSAVGFGTSLLRFVAEYRTVGGFDRLRGLLVYSRTLALGLATLVGIVGAGLVVALGDVVANYYLFPFVLGMICLPMFALTAVQDGLARSFNWVGVALVPPFILRPLLLVVPLLGAWLAGAPATAETALLIAIGSIWLTAVLQYLALRRRLRAQVPAGPRTYQPAYWLRISGPMLLIEGSYVLMSNTDVIVLSLFVPPDQVGLYFAAAKLLAIVSMVHYAVGVAAGHRFAALQARGDHPGLAAFVRNATSLTFWPSLAAAVAVVIAAYPLLSLFGPAFVAAFPVTLILALGILTRASIGPAERLLNVVGGQDACARIYLGSLAANFGLNLIAVPLFGILGAAGATSLAMIFESYMLNRAVKENIGTGSFVITARGGVG